MDDCVVLSQKRIGDQVQLTDRFAVTLNSLHSNRASEDNPALVTYVLGATLHDEPPSATSCAPDTPITLTFQFARSPNDAFEFEDRDTRYALAVDFVGRSDDDDWSLDLCLRYVDIARSEQLTFSDHVLRSGKQVGADEAKREIFIMGVQHDETEGLVRKHLPRVLSQFENDVSAELFNRGLQTQRRALPPLVFWESGREGLIIEASAGKLLTGTRFALPLEGHLASASEFLQSCYLLLLTGEHAVDSVRGWHGISKEEVDIANTDYGENGLAMRLIVGTLIPSFMRSFIALGEGDTRTALTALLKSERLADILVERVVHLYEIILDDTSLERLQKRQDQWARAKNKTLASIGGNKGKWYFSRYFSFELPDSYNQHSIQEHRTELVNFVYDTAHWIMLEPSPDTSPEDRYRTLYPSQLKPDQMKRMFDQVQSVSEERGWKLDERHFADVNRIVNVNYGHPGYTHFTQLEEKVRDRDATDNTERFFRSLVSFLNVVTVMQKTGATRAVLVVGSGHSADYKQLFDEFVNGVEITQYDTRTGVLSGENGGMWQQDLTEADARDAAAEDSRDVASVQRKKLERFAQAYLALEALSQWMGAPVTGLTLPRLEYYFLLELSDRYRHRDSISLEYQALAARFMGLSHYLLVTGSPFFGPRGTLAETPPRKRNQTDEQWMQTIAALHSDLPRIVIDMLIYGRKLRHLYHRRTPGYIFLQTEGVYTISVPDLHNPVTPLPRLVLEGGDRKTGMTLIAVKRRCFQVTLKSALLCRRCGSLTQNPKLECEPHPLIFCSTECQLQFRGRVNY